MSRGLAYDSDEGRAYAAAITSIMTGEAYVQSAETAAAHGGPFIEYKKNEKPFLRVIGKHRDARTRSQRQPCRKISPRRQRMRGIGRSSSARRTGIATHR